MRPLTYYVFSTDLRRWALWTVFMAAVAALSVAFETMAPETAARMVVAASAGFAVGTALDHLEGR